MKKAFKLIGVFILVVVALYLIAFCMGKYGWKLYGFDMCETPQNLLVETVYVTDEDVHIIGDTASSASSYVGYTYKIKDNVLYIGIKQNILFGFVERRGRYSFAIEDDFKNIDSIYFVSGEEQRCIWTLEKDKKHMEKIQKVRLYDTIHTSAEKDYKAEMLNAEYVYADEEFLDRIQHPVFSVELCLSKGGYLGVAELENGEEIYLDFERHYNTYYVIGKGGHFDY